MSSYSDHFGTDYCPYMSLISSSKDSIIYANIDTSKFYVTLKYEHNVSKCEIPFNESSLCGVSIGNNQDWTKQCFIYWGYDENDEKYFIRTVYYSQFNPHKCTYNFINPQYLHTDSLVFQLTYTGLMAYGFDYYSVYFYDLQIDFIYETRPITENLSFTPCDLSLSDTTRLEKIFCSRVPPYFQIELIMSCIPNESSSKTGFIDTK